MLRSIMWLGLSGLCAAVLSLAGAYLYLDPQIPSPESYRNVKLETPLRVEAMGGELMAVYGERRSIPVRLEEVPQQFISALLDTEDKRFYQHSGIDFISLSNDLLTLAGSLLTTGEVTAGASTITMQLARNISFSLERRFMRKFKEMLLALKIERELSKDEILELYINMAPFGKRAYGAQAAAFTYYGKPLSELNLPQLAMLAGIPQRPSAANPVNGPKLALARRNVVLARMRAQDSITQEQFEAARKAPISARIYATDLDVPSPYAAEWVRQQAIEQFPDLYTAGYVITTTIDAAKQREAVASLRRGLVSYDRRHGYRGAEMQVPQDLLERLQRASGVPAGLDPELTAALQGLLQEMPAFGGQDAAVVVAVDDTTALAMNAQGTIGAMSIDDAAWARPYVSVNRRGPAPQAMTELVQPGDIIRYRPAPPPQDSSATQENGAEQNSAPAAAQMQPVWLLVQQPAVEGALVSLDPHTGAVQALVGGYDFYRNQYNHALQAARQPGSGFKPFVYSAALNAGVTPADLFMDAPLVFDDDNLESQYRPDNDNNRYNGPTRLREALYRSINLVSMRVLLKVGAGTVLEHAQRFGFDTSSFPRNTQLAIGGGTMAITPMQMARAYAVFANGGYLVDPYIVASIRDADGNEVFRANMPRVCPECEQENEDKDDNSGFASEDELATESVPDEPSSLQELLEQESADAAGQDTQVAQAPQLDGERTPEALPEAALEVAQPSIIPAPRVLDERNAYIMQSMLKDVIRRGTGRAAMRLERTDLAGKTGTTNDAADTWFNGFSPQLVTTVWVGFSNHDPLGSRAFGSNTPLPIWIDFMQDALQGTEQITPRQPPGVATLKIDPETGQRARAGQPDAIFEYFLSEHLPAQPQESELVAPDTEEQIQAIDLF